MQCNLFKRSTFPLLQDRQFLLSVLDGYGTYSERDGVMENVDGFVDFLHSAIVVKNCLENRGRDVICFASKS